MNMKKLLVAKQSPHAFSKTQMWEHSWDLLYQDPISGFILAKGQESSHWDRGFYGIIDSPHPELLKAFFHLSQPKRGQSQFLAQSPSLISIMEFCQRLILEHSFHPIEVIRKEVSGDFWALMTHPNGEFSNPIPKDVQYQKTPGEAEGVYLSQSFFKEDKAFH